MKEKKLIASVILGVALVSLITALVAAFAESLTCFIDIGNVENVRIRDDYQYIVGGITLGVVVLGIAFVAVFFANKKSRFAVNLSLAIALVVYCVATMIVLRCIVPTHRTTIYADGYALFTSYLTTAITLLVSCALTFAAWLYLTLIKKKEELVKTEPETEV